MNSQYPKTYGQWSGKPSGYKPDYTRCAAETYDNFRFHQCSRKRGYGKEESYCKQHAKKNP